MKLQDTYRLILGCSIMLFYMGCSKDFLDTKIDTAQTQETLNSNYNTLFSLANAPYNYLRNEFTIMDNNLFASVSDEAVHTSASANVRSFNNGSWSQYDNPDNYYASYYSGIRAANYFIEQSVDYKNWLALNRDTISTSGKTNYQNDVLNIGWYRAEAHILRAFFYFELAKRYGGVPLVTNTLTIRDNTNIPRSPFEDIISFIVSEVDTYKNDLQPNWKTSSFTSNDGRLTRGAALALKARALLYAASPLHNPSNDGLKWRRAAEALNDVIVFAQGAGAYSLHNNYQNYFLESNTLSSAETIWAIRYQANNTPETNNYPISTPGGSSGITPSHNLVAEYEYKGTPDPADPYANRDPRLYFTVVTNNSTWNNRTINEAPGGSDDMKKANTSRTGYYLKKFLNDNMNLVQGATKTHNWAVFRYGEVLLEYSEAMNEAFGPDNNNGYSLTARQALNMVRGRTGVAMAPVTIPDQTGFRDAVKHERRIELAFENYRFWDLLRWKDAEIVLNQAITGVLVNKSETGVYTYTTVTVENRMFNASKMYYYPLPQVEITKSKGVLEQNPGW